MEVIELTISNWGKFNPEEETKTPFWFRVNINIGSSESLFGLSPATKWIWICLLSEAKRKKSSTISLNLAWAANNWNIKLPELKQSIESLNEKGLLRVNSNSTPTEIREDSALQTNMSNKQTNMSDFDFEKIYAEYPRKEGKAKGLESCASQIKTQSDYEDLENAVVKYRSICQSERREKKHIKMFSSFMNEKVWKDYTDPEAGTTTYKKTSPTILLQPILDLPISKEIPSAEAQAKVRQLIRGAISINKTNNEDGPGAA